MGCLGYLRGLKTILFFVYITLSTCECAKINTPRVLLPWFENLNVNFTFEIIEGGCYSWSLSRDDIIDLEPIYEDSWGHCSRAARVSVSKTCVPPGSVIILAEEVSSGEILRGDVDIDIISSLKVMSTTWKLYLEEAPEAFEVVASDDQGNTFSTLDGVSFEWNIENIGKNSEGEPLVTLVRWRDTDYEAPKGITELEAQGQRSHSVLLYGQAMGKSRVTVCLGETCTYFDLQVVASVVLTPAIAYIAQGDNLRYRVVRARAGRLTMQNITDTLYNMEVPDTGIANLEDAISLVRGVQLGSSSVYLMSGATEVATATLTVVRPHSIRVTIRPSELLVVGERFTVHCVMFDEDGHQLVAGQDTLIRLTVDGEANINLIRSTENGTITDAMAENSGKFVVTARLHSIAGMMLQKDVEGKASAAAVDPLEMDPPDLFIAWTDVTQEVQLKHRGGGNEPVTWSVSETGHSPLSLAPDGALSVHGEGEIQVRVHLRNYPHVKAIGSVRSAAPQLVVASSSGHARALRPHALHVALAAARADTGELYNFHVCNCDSFAVSLLEGPEPQNVTAAPWIQPIDGACCAFELVWAGRGASTVRVSRGRAGDSARVMVRAAPALLWPAHAAALTSATLPVLAVGEALAPVSEAPRVAALTPRAGPPPHLYPDAQLFTLTCMKKGDTNLDLVSYVDGEPERARLETACAPQVTRLRLEPPAPPGNCSARVWLRPGQEVMIKVTLFDAIGRELLDEQGPSVSWDTQPNHLGVEYKSSERLFVETDPEFDPVPVPLMYYQLVEASEKAIGWSGTLRASAPEATATVQARVVAPLKCEPLKVNIAWESENIPNVVSVTGGSGRYAVESPKGVAASVEGGHVHVVAPAPGVYDLVVSDQCVNGEKQIVEVNVEEVMSVEVVTSRAVCAGRCVAARALVRGASQRPLAVSGQLTWRAVGPLSVRAAELCGVSEGVARVSAGVNGVWSAEVEVWVFPELRLEPGRSRLPPGGRLQLRPEGGPPRHLASLHYHVEGGAPHVDVSGSGYLQALSVGAARVRLVATDAANAELASAEAEVEVIHITQLGVHAATQTLLVGRAAPLWLEAGGLRASALGALQPPPRVTWTLRDASAARLYASHVDDQLERSVAEGLTVRVVPLKAGLVTVDVRVRNLGQIAESRSWDSTIEILGIADIRTSVSGLTEDLNTGERLALAVGATVQLKALPRGTWTAYGDGAFELKDNGEVKALKPGFGVIFARHKDDRNNIFRETVIHIEVATPLYCTIEAGSDAAPGADTVSVIVRSALGRPLLAPKAELTFVPPHGAILPTDISGINNEIVLTGLEVDGAYVSVETAVGGTKVTDEVWVAGADAYTNRIIGVGGWCVCVEGEGWRGPGGVSLVAGAGLTLAVLMRTAAARYVLRRERPAGMLTIHQLPIDKMEFIAGEWPSSFVPLTIQAAGLSSGPLLCTEEQKYALHGVQVDLPFACRTKAPHTAQSVLDISNGQFGCSIIPAAKITELSEVDMCAEWESFRTCTTVYLLPSITLSQSKVSLLESPTVFKIHGHPQALHSTKLTTSPGLKLKTSSKSGEISVSLKGDGITCGTGWVHIVSRLTAQELRVEVARDCDIACGTLLGAVLSILKPYLPTLITLVAVAIAFLYLQGRLQQKSQLRLPMEPPQTQQVGGSPRARTWARSPYAGGPAPPVYGDTSVLPDTSYSPTRTHSRFL